MQRQQLGVAGLNLDLILLGIQAQVALIAALLLVALLGVVLGVVAGLGIVAGLAGAAASAAAQYGNGGLCGAAVRRGGGDGDVGGLRERDDGGDIAVGPSRISSPDRFGSLSFNSFALLA